MLPGTEFRYVLLILVRAVDPGEVCDLPGSRLGVQPLRVTPLAVLQRGVTEHLEEFEARLGGHLARQLAVLLQRADRGHQHDLAGVGEQGRDVRQPAQVLGAVGHREAEVGVEAVPQVVPVENVCGNALFEQLLLDEHRHRRLARSRQAGEPHGPALRQPVLGGAQRFVAHRVGARRARRDVRQDHAGRDGAVGVRVDQDERTGGRVAAVLVEQQRHLRAQRDAAQFIEFERGRRLVAVQRVDVEPVVERGRP